MRNGWSGRRGSQGFGLDAPGRDCSGIGPEGCAGLGAEFAKTICADPALLYTRLKIVSALARELAGQPDPFLHKVILQSSRHVHARLPSARTGLAGNQSQTLKR